MYKYLCAIILGILIYILLNQYNSFSVGGQEEGAHCKRPNYIREHKISKSSVCSKNLYNL